MHTCVYIQSCDFETIFYMNVRVNFFSQLCMKEYLDSTCSLPNLGPCVAITDVVNPTLGLRYLHWNNFSIMVARAILKFKALALSQKSGWHVL